MPRIITWPSFRQYCRLCGTQQFWGSLNFDGDEIGDLHALELIQKLKDNPNQETKQISPIRSKRHREWIPIKTAYYKQILRNIDGLNTDVISTIVKMAVGTKE
tara:strand:- start:8789 stop:9097 length:309 start_codon:yes stop_codon:yes gene_type:complete